MRYSGDVMKSAVTRRRKQVSRGAVVDRWPFGSAAPWGSDDPESRSLLGLIAQSTNDGIWVLDLATQRVYFSERWLEHVGYSPGELPGHFNSFFDRVHPRDQARVKLALDQYVSGEKPEYRVEFRMLHKDGSWRQILTRGIALRDAAGRPFRMAGTHTDITERTGRPRPQPPAPHRGGRFTAVVGVDLRAGRRWHALHLARVRRILRDPYPYDRERTLIGSTS
jgi:PAS domain S-box-containing protein